MQISDFIFFEEFCKNDLFWNKWNFFALFLFQYKILQIETYFILIF